MEYSMEFHGTLMSPNKVSLSSMKFQGTLRLPFYGILTWTSKGYSMEFHGTLESPNKKCRVPWDSKELGGRHFKWQVFHGIPWNIPKNSMELWCRQMKYHLVPWNSIECFMEFHGTLAPPNEVSLISMEFHGILRLSCYSMSYYPGLPWDIPWNSMELWCRQMTYHLFPWNSMEHSMEFHEFHGTFHGIPWNFGVAKWSIT